MSIDDLQGSRWREATILILFYHQVCNQKLFRAGEVLWNKSTSIKNSLRTREKRAFLLRYSKNTFWIENLTQKKDTIRAFFPPNQGTFFDFQKRAGNACPSYAPHSCALVQLPPAQKHWDNCCHLASQRSLSCF